MSDNSSNNKRIAKNTLLLYLRMIVVMVLGLYTSRIVLQALGVDDFGLYNVVGGVVGLFAFLRTSMEKCTQRFLNVEMAKPDGRLNDTFCVSATIHILIALAILLLTESIGLWFLNTQIQIPEGREVAANWIYQSAVIGLVFIVLTIPYSATIIAHERMGFFAVVSIVDAILKLIIAYLILIDDGDRLILYGILMGVVSVINFFMYAIYCKTKFSETRFRLLFDKVLFQQIFGFTSWTLIGQMAILGTNQGNNILVNMFHSVAANASMSIGSQVNAAVVSLTSNFQTAFNPQITKSYASGDYSYLKFLIYSTTKISFALLFIVSLPLMYNIDFALGVWLTEVPEKAGVFCILTLCNGIMNAVSAPLNFTVMASGKIKWFQIMTSIVYLSDLVILYALFSMGLPAETALYVKVSIMFGVLAVRLYYATKAVPSISVSSYCKEVLLPLVIVSITSVVIAAVLMMLANTIFKKVLATCLMTLVSAILLYYIALSKQERGQVNKLITSFTNKIRKK